MNQSNRNTRVNFNQIKTGEYAPVNSSSPFTNALSAQMDAEHAEYLLKLEAFNAMAEKTLVKDALVPYLNRPFGEILTVGTHKMGYKMAVLNAGGKSGTVGSDNTWAAVNAMVDAFATNRYAGGLVFNQHTRLFDPASPIERDVRAQFDGSRWQRFDWIARAWKLSTPFGKEMSRWLPKHREIDMMLMALARDYEYHVVFFEDAQYAKFERNVMDRLNMTITEAIKAKSEDWGNAQAAAYINREGEKVEGPVAAGAVIVDGLDLTKIGVDVTVMVTTPLSSVPYPKLVKVGDEAAIKSIAVSMNKSGFAFHLKTN